MRPSNSSSRSTRGQSLAGFSLIELMVGIVVGMVGLLVIYKTLSVWDMRTRSTTAGGDAQVGGTIAMYSLERSIKLAGMGFGVAPADVMGCTVTGTDTLNARALSFALYPLQIVPGVPAGSPDTINVLTGNSSFFVTEGTFNVSTATTKKLVRRDGFRSGDVAVVAGNGAASTPSSSDCRLVQITDNTAADGVTLSHASGALVADPAFPSASGNSQFNAAGGTGTTFTSGTIYNLGPKPSLMRWQVAGGRVLTGTDYLQDTPTQQVADGVISIKAEYGVDLDKDTIIEASEWTTATPTDWTLVRAVRVALLMRVGQFEKPEASSASAVAVTNAAPFWTHGDGTTTPFLMTNVDGSADSYGPGDVNANNWRYYRYRVYEKVIPLRNVIWGDHVMTGHRAMNSSRTGPRIAPRRQRGVVMWVALGVLIVMTLAGLGMIRQMGGGLSIAGNVAFKQSATALADLGTEEARAWLVANSTALNTTNVALGYHATWGTVADPVVGDDPSAWTTDWNAVTATTDPATGNSVKWVIHRLCAVDGAAPNAVGQKCSSVSGTPSGKGLPASPFTQPVAPYYRITTQVVGPRNTVSYIQVIVSA